MGRVLEAFTATGIRPKFADKLKASGIRRPGEFLRTFGQPSEAEDNRMSASDSVFATSRSELRGGALFLEAHPRGNRRRAATGGD